MLGNCQRLAKLGLGGHLSVRDCLSQERVAIDLTKPSLKNAFFRLIHDPQRFVYRLKAFIRLIVDPIGFGQKREPTWLVHPCSGCQKICDTVAQLNNSSLDLPCAAVAQPAIMSASACQNGKPCSSANVFTSSTNFLMTCGSPRHWWMKRE